MEAVDLHWNLESATMQEKWIIRLLVLQTKIGTEFLITCRFYFIM